MLPFLGLYRSIDHKALPLRRLVYPVPHPINPFLGVHFTITTDQKIKIGPTAIPILGREQYSISEKWSFSDIREALTAVRALILNDAHSLREILAIEGPNLLARNLVKEGATLVPSSANISGWSRKPAGIRAQLVNLTSGRLEQDFIIEQYQNSTHILNAVSPGWTSAIPFGRYVASLVLSEKF
jgi:L-2-hydroxyglutarate oxidase LhgO